MTKTSFALLALPFLFLTACQTMPYQPYAREVKRMPGGGGEIALKIEHRDEDRAKAQMMMTSNCGSAPLKVLEEGEVVVGQTTNSTAHNAYDAGAQGTQVGTFLGMPVTSGGRDASTNTSASATTTALKEWNIKYECEKVVAEGPKAPAETAKPSKKRAKK